jgi:hypothetical protein
MACVVRALWVNANKAERGGGSLSCCDMFDLNTCWPGKQQPCKWLQVAARLGKQQLCKWLQVAAALWLHGGSQGSTAQIRAAVLKVYHPPGPSSSHAYHHECNML